MPSFRCAAGVAASILMALGAAAQQPESCGTDAVTTAVAEALHRANARRDVRMQAAAASADARNGMFVVPRSPATALLDHANDLEGKTLRFRPAGGDRYALTVEALQYDEQAGSVLRAFAASGAADWHTVKLTLQSLRLPLFGQSVDTLYLTAFNSIALAPPRAGIARQYDALEAALTAEPTIAPLLMSDNRPYALGLPAVWARETADFLLVTWRAGGAVFSYDVQAKLAKSGEITFSYRTLGRTTWGAVLISPGAAAWGGENVTKAEAADAAGDVAPAVPAAMRATLDLRSLAVRRAGTSGLYRVAVRVGAPIGSALPRRGDSAQLAIRVGDAPPMIVTLTWNGGGGIAQPGRTLPASTALRVAGDEVELSFLRDSLGALGASSEIVVTSSLLSMPGEADRMTAQIELEDGAEPGVDLSAASGAELSLPIVEAFTLPAVDLQSVWERVRAAASLADDDIDGVAVFQNFYSDLVLYAGAFASGGNPQADGVSMYAGKGRAFPRSPTLMQMNAVGYGNNQDTAIAGRVLLHELGHRWLQFVETLENATRTIALNPQPAHPPQFASAPAAFPVMGAGDTSTMGGGAFTQAGNSFTSGAASAFGLSWLDLYLMGLAAPQEVPPTFVIDNANPPLGLAYTPPSNMTVTGTRHELTIEQVVAAMGPRTPAYGSSQRSFRIAFVLLATDPSTAAGDLARVDAYRRAFEENFHKATGGRAAVQTLVYPPSPRRRSVRP